VRRLTLKKTASPAFLLGFEYIIHVLAVKEAKQTRPLL
jgi:hypothetical protein